MPLRFLGTQQMGYLFTDLNSSISDVKRFSMPSMAVLLTIQGKCAGLRAKTVNVSGHLPPQYMGW